MGKSVMDKPSDLLADERAAYESLKDSLVSQGLSGKWIVIAGKKQIVIRDDAEAANAAGVEAVGLDRPFLLKQIGTDDSASVPALHFGLIYAHH